jgi:hypothetical protein
VLLVARKLAAWKHSLRFRVSLGEMLTYMLSWRFLPWELEELNTKTKERVYLGAFGVRGTFSKVCSITPFVFSHETVIANEVWTQPSSWFSASLRHQQSYLVDPASSHMLVSKIKPCMNRLGRALVRLESRKCCAEHGTTLVNCQRTWYALHILKNAWSDNSSICSGAQKHFFEPVHRLDTNGFLNKKELKI